MNKIWNKHYECQCGTEVLMVSKNDFDKDTVYVSIFRNSFHKAYALTFKARIRSIWDIIVHGTVWYDNIMLDKSEANRLGKDLIEFSKGVKNVKSSSKSK